MNVLPKRRAILVKAVAAFLLLVPWSAAQDGGGGETAAGADGAARGGLRIAHLAPEGPSVDVLVDGEAIAEDLAPSTVSAYVFVQPGDRAVEVVFRDAAEGGEAAPADVDPAMDAGVAPPAPDPAGQADAVGPEDPPAPDGGAGGSENAPDDQPPATAGPPTQEAPLLERTVSLEAGSYATLVLSPPPAEAAQEQDAEQQADAAAGADGAPPAEVAAPVTLEGAVVQDGLRQLPRAGEAMVRVVHGAPRIGALSVVHAFRPEDVPQESEGSDAASDEGGDGRQGPRPIEGEALADGLSAGETAEYAPVQAGMHHLQVQTQDGVVAVDLQEMRFESGLVYTLYLAATQDGADVVLTTAVDAGVSADGR